MPIQLTQAFLGQCLSKGNNKQCTVYVYILKWLPFKIRNNPKYKITIIVRQYRLDGPYSSS